jgi:hypothetical protein
MLEVRALLSASHATLIDPEILATAAVSTTNGGSEAGFPSDGSSSAAPAHPLDSLFEQREWGAEIGLRDDRVGRYDPSGDPWLVAPPTAVPNLNGQVQNGSTFYAYASGEQPPNTASDPGDGLVPDEGNELQADPGREREKRQLDDERAVKTDGSSKRPQGQEDEEAFRRALLENGVDPKVIDILIETAREVPRPRRTLIGAHQVCVDWVFEYERRMEEALKRTLPPYEDGTPRTSVPGIASRRYLICNVPLGAQGNELQDIPYLNKNWIIPTFLDVWNYGGPARNGSCIGHPMPLPEGDPLFWRKRWLEQMHAVYKIVLADGSVWYIDLGMIQTVRAGHGSVDELGSGPWHITPGTSLPAGWIPTGRTAQPSGEPREDD